MLCKTVRTTIARKLMLVVSIACGAAFGLFVALIIASLFVDIERIAELPHG